MKNLNEKFKKIKLLVLDFDVVMTDNRVLVSEGGKESVLCHRGDGLGIEMLNKQGIEVVVISKEKNPVVQARCKKLDIKCWQGADRKNNLLLREIKKRNLELANVCFIGNDINDLECIKIAGIGIAVADSHQSILKIADYVTNKLGGGGAIREVCDLLLSSKNYEFQ